MTDGVDDSKGHHGEPHCRRSAPAPPLTISSEELLQGRRELMIQHQGETYRLRVTRNGKLILTK